MSVSGAARPGAPSMSQSMSASIGDTTPAYPKIAIG
jgi:hypothetical protein